MPARIARNSNATCNGFGRRRSLNTSPMRQHQERGRQSTPRYKQQPHTVAAILQNKGDLVFYSCLVDNKPVQCLRDSGCSTLIVDSSLVDTSQLTGNSEFVRLGDGTKLECPTATIFIESPWVKGHVTALTMNTPIAEVIIGNLPDVPDNSKQLFQLLSTLAQE
ncbi:hypothetical protein Btru_067455 [Bulinus truncatus]|nr:hypothetical protein Btru_067455 [Bulinus truncatus]